MIFYDAFSMGPLITKSSKIGKRVQILSLSLHTKRNARQQTPPPPSNNGSRRHRHRASEGVRARLRATGEKMHETRPTRVYAHREQDGVRCVLSINIIIIIIIIALFFRVSSLPISLDFLGEIKYIYISRRCLALGLTKKRSLSTSFKTRRQGLSCLGSSGSS